MQGALFRLEGKVGYVPYPRLAPFFEGSSVRFRAGLEGQRVENGMVILGDRSGPECDAGALLHEMGHFVEIDEARMAVERWGFYRGEWIETPRDRYKSGFHLYRGIKDLEREIRVLAIQFNVSDALGIPCDQDGWLSAMQFVPGFDNLRYARDWSPRRTHRFVRASVMDARRSSESSYAYFVAEWHRRNGMLASHSLAA